MYITSIKKLRIFLVIISLQFFLLACENAPVEFSSLSEEVVASFASLNPSLKKNWGDSEEIKNQDLSEEIQYQDLKEGIRWADDSEDRSFTAGELTITLDKVNILFVIDNSGSMKEEQESIANQFDSFLTSLQGTDYNIAIITTDAYLDTYKGKPKNGNFEQFPNGKKWLTGAQDTSKAYLQKNIEYFQQAMKTVGITGSGFERGLASTVRALEKEDQKEFFRPNALLMIIIVSDEDETGIISSRVSYDDRANALFDDLNNKIKKLYDTFYNLHNADSASYGTDPIVIHSIIGVPKEDFNWAGNGYRPGDGSGNWYEPGDGFSYYLFPYLQCPGSNAQDGFTQGYTYKKASQGMLLSGTDLKAEYGNIISGQVLSICETNYGSQLKPISEQAINNRVVSLPCVPNSKENVFILTPDDEKFHPDRLEGKIIYIEKSIPFGTKINVYFTCPK